MKTPPVERALQNIIAAENLSKNLPKLAAKDDEAPVESQEIDSYTDDPTPAPATTQHIDGGKDAPEDPYATAVPQDMNSVAYTLKQPPAPATEQDISVFADISRCPLAPIITDNDSVTDALCSMQVKLAESNPTEALSTAHSLLLATTSGPPSSVFSSFNSDLSTRTTPKPLIVTPGLASYVSFLTNSSLDVILAQVNTKLDNDSILLAQGKALVSRIETLKSRTERLRSREAEMSIELESLGKDEESFDLLSPEQETRIEEDVEWVRKEVKEVKASFAGLGREWMTLVENLFRARGWESRSA